MFSALHGTHNDICYSLTLWLRVESTLWPSRRQHKHKVNENNGNMFGKRLQEVGEQHRTWGCGQHRSHGGTLWSGKIWRNLINTCKESFKLKADRKHQYHPSENKYYLDPWPWCHTVSHCVLKVLCLIINCYREVRIKRFLFCLFELNNMNGNNIYLDILQHIKIGAFDL